MKQDYFALPGYSNSELGWFEVSPEYYQYKKNLGGAPTDAMLLGSAVHYLAFEPENFKEYMMVLDRALMPEPTKDFRTKVNQEWRSQQFMIALEKGIEIIDSDDLKIAQIMANKLLEVPESRDLIRYTRAKYEAVLQWEADGLRFKGKVDELSDLFLLDLKTMQDASPGAVRHAIWQNRIFRQLGMYADGDRIINDTMVLKDCYVVAIESKPPYGVSVHKIAEDYLEFGITEYRKLAKGLALCEKANHWPTYTCSAKDGIEFVELPKFLKE
jgi:hypothetical protein